MDDGLRIEGDRSVCWSLSGRHRYLQQDQVTRRTGKVNYDIQMPDKGGRKQVFHINHLRKWQERTFEVNAVIENEDAIEDYRLSNKHQPHFGQQLSQDQKKEVVQSLSRFPQVDTPGKTNKAMHKIRTMGNPPVRQKPYRIPHAYREKVLEELEGMERDGIIEKSESEWASPLVVVTKKDGGIRLCVDYRKLNQVTKFDAYLMPRVDELLDKIGNAQFITTLDLAKGYGQVPVSKDDREKTGFVSPKGLYQFITMPFGLSGAPATFQRMMDSVLRGTEAFAGVYLDDIVIYSKTWQDHLTHLRDVFQRLEDAHLTVNMKKCVFGVEDCVYLGYRIGQGGVRPEESRIQAILDITQPKTKKR